MTEATEEALSSARPATVRARFRASEGASPEEVAAAVDRVGAGGRVSHGLVLKAPDDPEVAAAVRRAGERGIPTVTLVTDVGGSGRVAYVGLDNAAAGATAAYLLTRLVGAPGGCRARDAEPPQLPRRAGAARRVPGPARRRSPRARGRDRRRRPR